MSKKQLITNSFTFGAVGERISGFRTSEIYANSAKEIRNLLITDMGTLKVAKSFTNFVLNITGTVLKTAETSENTYIILTSTNLYLINKQNNSINKAIQHSLGENADASLIGKEILCLFDRTGNTQVKFYNIKDFSDKTLNLKYPIKDKEVVELAIYRISKDPIDEKKLRLTQMSNFLNPKIKLKGGNIYLTQSDIQIKRIYIDYNVNPQIDYFNGAVDGDIYAILRTTSEVKDGKSYIIDNTKVAFGALTFDDKYKGKYFTNMTGSDADGIFVFGNLVDITKPTNASFYQDRMVFYVDNYIYFSKLREFEDFRNDVYTDSPFFIQLNPINNTIGTLKDFVSANGLYVLTTAGIYVIGYGTMTLTPASISSTVVVATDMQVGDSYEVVDNILYFINGNNVLKSLILDRSSQQLAFRVHTVDKYSSKPLFKDITKISVEDKDYLMARSLDNKTMYLIESIDYEGLFRKTALDFNFENKAFGLTDRFVIGNKVFKVGSNNYDVALIVMNPPALQGDSILVDNSSKIESLAIKVINENNSAIKGVILNGTNIQNLASEYDQYNIYRKRSNDKIGTSYSIKILSNENDKIIELQTLQILVNVIQDI